DAAGGGVLGKRQRSAEAFGPGGVRLPRDADAVREQTELQELLEAETHRRAWTLPHRTGIRTSVVAAPAPAAQLASAAALRPVCGAGAFARRRAARRAPARGRRPRRRAGRGRRRRACARARPRSSRRRARRTDRPAARARPRRAAPSRPP